MYTGRLCVATMSKKTPARVLEEWTERDLTAAAVRGEIQPAFEVEDQVRLASDILASGRSLVIAGEPGVGKTALVGELVRRAAAGTDVAALAGKRVLQFSFRQRAASLKQASELLPETYRLIEALAEAGSLVVPYFRDFHLAYGFDLEPQLQALPYRLAVPVIGEAEPATLAALLESLPELDQHYVTLTVEEPDLQRAAVLLGHWAKFLAASTGTRFSPGALEEALHLSHRFLGRSRLPRKAIDLLGQVASLGAARREVSREEIIERFSRIHHVPRVLVDPAEPLDLNDLQRRLEEELLGQEEAVEALLRMISTIKSGLSDLRRAFGVFLFVGPTGVGKTHAAQLLAQHLFGTRDRMIRLNMADFQTDGAPEVLFGDAGDYRPAQRRGVITQRTAGHPFAVLLLDEFEKAHEKVADRFLQLFDEGAFINGHGERIACRSMIMIATSNVGAELHREQPLGFLAASDEARLGHELGRRLSQRFRVELLNRFDQIVHFRPLSRANVRTIAARELQSLKTRVGFTRNDLELDVEEAVLDWLAVHGYDQRFGARYLRRTLEREVTSVVAGLLARGKVAPGTRVVLTVRRNRIDARLVSPDSPSVRHRESVTLPWGHTTAPKSLTREALVQKAGEVIADADTLLGGREKRRHEAGTLLESMNATGFWDSATRSDDTLERYRSLDVMIQVEERYAADVDATRTLIADPSAPLNRLARAVEAAAVTVRRWKDRLLEEGATDVWLVIERVDPLQSSGAWVAELARLELAWCLRLGLQAAVVAAQSGEDEPVRIVLQAEGPGASAYLAMEDGLHRRARPTGIDQKARVEIVPCGVERGTIPPVTRHRARTGPLGLAYTCSGRVDMPPGGAVIDLLGIDATVLGDVLADLSAHRRRDAGDRTVVARTYGRDGVGARDPRTGASVVRLRDALRGELEPFLEAWRQRDPPS